MSDVNANINIGVDTSIGIAEIKQLQRQIAQLNAQLLKSGAQQVRAADQIQRNLIDNINATGKFAANVRTISTTTEGFTTALERNKLSMGQYFRYAGASTKTFGRLFRTEFDTIEKVARERVKTLQTQFVKLGRDGSGAMKAIAVRPLALDMDNLATKTAIAAQKQQLMNQLLKQGSTNLLNFGKNTQWAGRQLMVGFSVPLAYLGTIASKTFMQMEEQAIRFKRVYGDTFTATAETDKMIEQIKQLAGEFTKYGVAVEKTMKMAADAAAMGKQGAELIAQVRQASTLAVLGGVEQDQALETAISLTNAFGIAAEDLAGKIDFLNAVENQTVTSIEDLTIAIPKAAPVIKQLGGDVQDLAFFLTAMKEGGINASEGANALKSGLASIINPTEKASKFLQGFGINLKGMVDANKGDVKGLVLDFASALDTLDPLSKARAIEQLFGKFQFARLSTLFQNVIAEGSQAERVLKLSATTAEELAILSEREMKRIEESPMYKFKSAVEDLKVSLVPLGEAFLKAITPLVEFAKGFLDNFNNMSDGAKQFTVIATTAIAGIGPVLLMSFGLVANGVANLIKLFQFIGKTMFGVGKTTMDLGSQTEYMTQQQLEAAAIASSLDQKHTKLIQTFTSEAGAVNQLASAYVRAQIAQSRLLSIDPRTGMALPGAALPTTRAAKPKKYAKGVVSVPGPKGAGDIVPAMLSPGEAVIPAKQSQKYSGLISGMINDDIPGFRFGRLGAAASGVFGKIKDKIGQIPVISKSKGKSMLDEWRQLNPRGEWGLMESILRTILKKRGSYQGVSSTSVEEKLFQRFIMGPGSRKVAVRMFSDDFMAAIARGDTRYQNVFERGVQSRGSLDMPGGPRLKAEEELFGLGANTPASARPSYGYLFGKEREISRVGGTFAERLLDRVSGKRRLSSDPVGYGKRTVEKATRLMNENTYRYGDIAMILRDRAIRGRTTITRGDSLNNVFGKYATPAPLHTRSKKKIAAANTSRDNDFFEAQIMGGFSFKDIKRIVATEPETILRLQESLRAAGITGIKVGMPRYTMMQKLRKFVYGKKNTYERRLPRIQPPSAGKYAGKYREDPLVINGRTFWSNGGTATKKDAVDIQDDMPSMSFDQNKTLQMSHMSPIVGVGKMTEAELVNSFDKELQKLKDGIASGKYAAYNLDPDKIKADFDARLAQAKDSFVEKTGRPASEAFFKHYTNIIEPWPTVGNQGTSTIVAARPATSYLNELATLPRGLFGSGILARLPKDHGIPPEELRKYILAINDRYEQEMRSRGAQAITEPENQRIFKQAEDAAVRQVSPKYRRTISEANSLARLGLTFGVAGVNGPGATRKYLASLFGNLQTKVKELRETTYQKFYGQQFIDELDSKFFSKTKLGRVPREVKDRYLKLVSQFSEVDEFRLTNQLIDASEDARFVGKGNAELKYNEYRRILNDFVPRSATSVREALPPLQLKKVRSTPKSEPVTTTTGTTGRGRTTGRGGRAGAVATVVEKFDNTPLSNKEVQGYLWPKRYANGVVSVPGPKGAGDVVPAMLSPGEAVIPTKMADKYAPLINSMISDSVPGYSRGKKGKGKKGPSFGSNYTGTQTVRKPSATVLTETSPMPGVVTQRRVDAAVSQKELATLQKQLKGNPFRRGINAITANITGAIATGIQNANIAKLMTKDYVAGFKENYRYETEQTRKSDERLARERAKRARAREGRRLARQRQSLAPELANLGAMVRSDGNLAFAAGQRRKGKAVGGRIIDGKQTASLLAQAQAAAMANVGFESGKRRQLAQEARRAKKLSKLSSYLPENVKVSRTGNLYHAAGTIDPVTGKNIGGDMLSRDAANAAIKDAKKQRFQARSGKIGGAGTGVGMAAMMYGMTGGPGADIAMMASLPLMMLPAILPLITNPIGAAVAGIVAAIGLVAGAAFLLNEQFKKTRDEAANLAISLGSGTKTLQPIAEFAGKATATDIMIRKRQNQFGQQSEGSQTFGSIFAQSEAGKSMISNLQNANKTAGKGAVSSGLLAQLSTSISSGLLTTPEAVAIAKEMGNQLGDAKLGLDVTAKIVDTFGPNGENLKNNPLAVRTKLMTETGKPLADFIKGIMPTITAPTNFGVAGITATDANGQVDTIQNRSGYSITGQKSNPFDFGTGTVPLSETNSATSPSVTLSAGQVGQFVGQTITTLQTQREIVASSDLYYDNLIDIAKARYEETKSAEDLKKLNDLMAKKESDRVALLKQGNAITQQIVTAYKSTTTAGQDQIISGLKAQAEILYKDSPFLETAKETIDKLDKLDLGGNEVVLAATVASGDIPADVMNTFLSGSAAPIQKDVSLIIQAQGSQTGLETIQLMNQFPGNEKIQKDIALRVEEGNIDLLNKLNAMGGASAVEFFAANPKAMARIEKTFDRIEGIKDLNVETVMEERIILDSTALAEFKSNQAYFDSLPEESQKTYLASYITAYQTISDEDVNDYIAEKVANAGGANSEGGKYTGIMYAGYKGKAKARAEMAAELGKDAVTTQDVLNNQLGGKPETPKTTGGGSGKPKDTTISDLANDLRMYGNATIKANAKLTDFKNTTINFQGISQKMRFKGMSSEFINSVMAMDKQTRDKFVTIKNGVVTITKAGEALQTMFSKNIMGKFNDAQVEGAITAQNQTVALNRLRERGLSLSDALEVVQDREVANAIATGATTEEINKQIEAIKLRKAAELKFQIATPTGMRQFISEFVGKVDEGTGAVGEFFAAQERLANAKFESATANLKQDVRKAEQDIQNYRDTIDDLEFLLVGIKDKEDAINEKYDKRGEALDKIWKANSDIAKQQQNQLSVMSALASGDLAAAAEAMRQAQAARAEKAKEDQQRMLEIAREKELAKVTATGGKTRKQIEDDIKKNNDEILKIEEQKLEPAQKLIRAQEKIRDDALEAIAKDGYLGKTKEGWALIAAEAANAAVQSNEFKKSLEETLKLIPGLTIAAGVVSFDPAQFASAMTGTVTAAQNTDVPGAGDAPVVPKDEDPNAKKIADLNARILANRSAVVASPGTTATDKKLMAENVKLIKELRILTGDPTAGKPVNKAMGGIIAKRFATGGFAMGTDIVPAMLTPGEFVVRKYAVDNFGLDNLKAINNGTFKGDSMYNYEVNVNVKSDANPDQIARAVMTQIKQIDSQRIRSNRY